MKINNKGLIKFHPKLNCVYREIHDMNKEFMNNQNHLQTKFV